MNSTIVRDVLYGPEASDCLLSTGNLEDRGTELETKSAKKSILLRRNGKAIMRGYRKNRMWLVVHSADVKAYKSTERSTDKLRSFFSFSPRELSVILFNKSVP